MADYFIIGGYLKIHKTAMTQEMFMQKSLLRTLLNWQSDHGFSAKHPSITDADDKGMVTIRFDSTSQVNLGDDPGKLLSELKQKYRERVGGRVLCRGWMNNITIDLDTSGESVQYIL